MTEPKVTWWKSMIVAIGAIACACTSNTSVSPTGQRGTIGHDAAQSNESNVVSGDSVQIVENRQLEVSTEAELSQKYLEMQIDSGLADRLVRHHLNLNLPEGFTLNAAKGDAFWSHDFDLKSDSGKVEVMFAVGVDPDAGGMASPELSDQEHISRELMNIIISLNGGSLVAEIQQHPPEQARSRFNANAYVTATFAPDEAFHSAEIGFAGLFFHKTYGRVVYVVLFDGMDDPQSRLEWGTGETALTFVADK